MYSCRRVKISLAIVVSLVSSSEMLFAHPGHSHVGPISHSEAFQAGLLHPFHGIDHLLAMIAIGLLAFRAGGRRSWILPTTFLGSMLAGCLAAGISLPAVELCIATSVLVFGTLVAIKKIVSLKVLTGLIITFAIFHGHAHATEMSANASLPLYTAGFLISTALLIAIRVVAGAVISKQANWQMVRYAGGGIAIAGLMLIVNLASKDLDSVYKIGASTVEVEASFQDRES